MDAKIATSKATKQPNLSELSIASPLFEKRIEFHIARKPFTGFTNTGGAFQLETLNPSTPNSSQFKPNLLAKKVDSVEVKENGFDPELSYQISFRRIGAGLMNLGNTCFLNSVLQCLTYTEPLAAYLQSGKHQSSCRTAGFCALCAIQKHVSSARQSTGRILAPNEIVSNLRCISRNFRNSRQEDAHEYMVNLLESMHKCCLPSGVPSESPSAYDKSSVHKIFGGRLRSQVKCMQCSYTSDKFDPFLDLSLEIVKADSLHKALTHFTAKEFLDGGEKHYQCQQCKQKVKALKQLTIHKAPYVLTIHLKRFSSHLAGQKIDKKIIFGTTLDLKPFVTDPCDGDLKYTLYGVLVHAGWSTHSGHYYCFVRTSSGLWYRLDDNRVIQVSEKIVLEQKAYMLFYYRERRNFHSNKSFDVVQKHNANPIEKSKSDCGSDQGLKENLTGQIEKKMNGSISSAANVQINSQIGVVPRKPLIKCFPVECSTANNSLEGHLSKRGGGGVECLLQDKPKISTSNVKALECGVGTGDKESAKNLFDTSSSDNVQKSVNSLCDSSAILPKGSQKGLDDAVAISANCSLEKSLKVTAEEAFSGENRCRSPMDKSNPLITARAKALNNNYQAKVPDISTIMPIRKHKSMPKGNEEKLNRRFKALSRCQTMKMQLSSKFLCVWKKKFKRSRKGELMSSNPIQKSLVDGESISSDVKPSTSQKYQTAPSGRLDHSGIGQKKSSSKRKEKSCVVNNIVSNINGDSLTENTVGSGERSAQGGAMLASSNSAENLGVSTSAGNSLNARVPYYSKHSSEESMQKGLMSVLTRGLEETVARWDEIGSNTAEMTNRSDVRNGSIGHIGDEWDEEYDRGKRKKVRIFKNDFSGPNPFQEIATMRTKTKKAKMDYSSTGNKPFRI